MIRIVLISYVLLISSIYFSDLSAGNKTGTIGSSFLTAETAPRPKAMGGAFTAVANDADTAFYNPAGYINIKKHEVSLTYQNGIDDMLYFSSAYAHAFNGKQAIGINGLFLSQGEMDIFTPEGDIDHRSIGSSYSLGAGYARFFESVNFSLGLNMKIIQSKLIDYSASTAGFDLGCLYNPVSGSPEKNEFSFGVSVLHLGPGLKYASEEDPLPRTIRAGSAYYYHLSGPDLVLLSALDAVRSEEYESAGIDLGLELQYHKNFFFRTGYSFAELSDPGNNSWNAGLGIQYSLFQFDYAFQISSSEIHDNTHTLGMIFRFGQ